VKGLGGGNALNWGRGERTQTSNFLGKNKREEQTVEKVLMGFKEGGNVLSIEWSQSSKKEEGGSTFLGRRRILGKNHKNS